MKNYLYIAIVAIVLGCSITKPSSINNSNKLNGTWIPIKEEIGGQVLPAAAFATQKLIIADSNYTFTAESIDKGVVQYSDTKLDIWCKEGVNKGKHFTGIYKLENNELTVCYNLLGIGYPEAFETKGKPNYFLCVFKKY